MSLKNRIDKNHRLRNSARKITERIKPAATRFARKRGEAAKHQVHRGRAWAAPRVRRSGKVLQEDITPKVTHVLQDTVAPKVSHLLTSAAHLIEPHRDGDGKAKSEAESEAKR